MTGTEPNKDANGETLTTHFDGPEYNGPVTIGPDMNIPAAPKSPSMKQIKTMDKQQKKMMKYITRLRKNQYKENGKVSKELKRLKAAIGLDDYNAIVAVATTFYPETKDKEGKVTKEAYNQTNWQAVTVEAKNLLVLRREMRMASREVAPGTGEVLSKAAANAPLEDRRAAKPIRLRMLLL